MRGIHVLPNLMTAANLACGFISIVLASRGGGRPDSILAAAWLILLANVFDVMDGRLARWTRGESEFGVEFDSLADLVSFGVAPAYLVSRIALEGLGAWGLVAAVLFVVAGALRLARYNVQARNPHASSHFFCGLPIPAAASMLATWTLVAVPASGSLPGAPAFVATLVLAGLMVSSLPYPAAKKPRTRHIPAGVKLAVLGVLIAAMATGRELLLFAVALTYICSGIMWKAGRILRPRVRPAPDGLEEPRTATP